MSNDGTHDFGYPCSMPSVITIDGLTIEDSKAKGVNFFGDISGSSGKGKPFPYRLTERLEVKGLRTTSGREPGIGPDPVLAKAVRIVR